MENKVKAALQASGLILFFCYVAGFLAWNIYLSHFGFFEYDLLQTRFLSAGFLILILPVTVFAVRKKSRDKFLLLNHFYQAVFFFVWVCFFAIVIFPYIPQYFGGAKPYLASLVSNSEMIKSFELMGLLYSERQGEQVETTRGCKLYENSDQILMGFGVVSLSEKQNSNQQYAQVDNIRIVAINKNQIQGTSVQPQGEVFVGSSVKVQLICESIRSSYSATLHLFSRQIELTPPSS